MDNDGDDELLGRKRVVNEELHVVLQRAKDRRLEEMKRYEMQQQATEATKLKKMEGENKDTKVNISYYLCIHFNKLFIFLYKLVRLNWFLQDDYCGLRFFSQVFQIISLF